MSTGKEKKARFLDKFGLGKKDRPTSQIYPGNQGLKVATETHDADEHNHNSGPLTFNPADYDLPEDEIEALFEKLLDDMNLTDEKKEPLRQRDLQGKKTLLTLHNARLSSTGSKLSTANDFIQAMSEHQLSYDKLPDILVPLRIALKNKPVSWVEEFGEKGLNHILLFMDRIYPKRDDGKDERGNKIKQECVRCLRAFMNNKAGLKQICGNKKAIQALCKALDHRNPPVMIEALNLLAAVCLVPGGHDKVLGAITDVYTADGSLHRFLPIIKGLSKDNLPLIAACLQLINALVTTPDDLDFRLHLRNEFMRMGLRDELKKIEKIENEEVKVQYHVFQQHREEDFEEFSQRYDNIRLELEDVSDCYEILKNSVMETASEPYFLSILQHLLYIREEPNIRVAYYQLIEECISQIVLHRGGCDPDFRPGSRFTIDVDPLIGQLSEKVKEDEGRSSKAMNKKLEETIMAKQEYEAKVAQLETKLREYESGAVVPDVVSERFNALIISAEARVATEAALHARNALLNTSVRESEPKLLGVGNVVNESSNACSTNPPACNRSGGPPPPPMPGKGGPPPPPMPGGGPPPPPPMPGMGGPPPPPPMPGMGGPPPPPPMPGKGGPPPPPPPPGMGPPPPPGGPMKPAGPPPLPHGLKPKKKYTVDAPMKKANWKKINPQDLSEKAFWVHAKEEELPCDDILKDLSSKFSTKPAGKVITDGGASVTEKKSAKKVKELKVLDSKTAQNLSILFGSLKLTPANLKNYLLRCDEENLTETSVSQLLDMLPAPEIIKQLEQFKDQISELADAEQFVVTLSSIKRLLPRLKSLQFKLRFNEIVSDIKPDIVNATEACEEIRKSKKFAKILEIILLMGNYMNSGSNNAQSFGFEISFITKLSGTKAIDNKTTLLHFLTLLIENKFPEVLAFGDELIHVDKASKVSTEQLQKLLNDMGKSVKQLEMDLENNKTPQSEDDRFIEIMTPFAKEARNQYEILDKMFKKMESCFVDIAEYFTFDLKKYMLEEFFTDIKTFKKHFKEAMNDNIKNRELEEKAKRAKEARENAERERQKRQEHKNNLMKMDENDNEHGVMDHLLASIQNGQAFSCNMNKPRKRAQRATGAARQAQLTRSRSRSGLPSTPLSPVDIDMEPSFDRDEDGIVSVKQQRGRKGNVEGRDRRPLPAFQMDGKDDFLEKLNAL